MKTTSKNNSRMMRLIGLSQLAQRRRRRAAAQRVLAVPRTRAELDAVTAADVAVLLNVSPVLAAAIAAMDDDK